MTLEEIKEQIKGSPVSQIIQNYIPLNRKGANLEAVCPFHADTKPSLKVNDQKGLYKCFACGAGGDSITFVMEYKKVDFKEAIKECAGILGISTEGLDKAKKSNPKIDLGVRVLNAAQKIYRKVATQKPASYLAFIEKRKLNDETIKSFQIGFAPHNSALSEYLNSLPENDKARAIKAAKEIGIIRDSQRGNGEYDFFRDRITFPIFDHHGVLKGFSSRAVREGQNPKYLNSGDSFLFKKGFILFAYHLAKKPIREKNQILIVEGHMDAIMLHQFGFNTAVATMGTALTEYSVNFVKNQVQNIYLCLDSDPAGFKASERINSLFLKHGVLPRYVDFSPHKDPDDFLNSEGPLALKERIQKAPCFIDALVEREIDSTPSENLDQKLETMRKIFSYLAPLGEHLQATERVVQAAKRLGLRSDSASIIEDYKGYLQNSLSYKTLKPQFHEPQEEYIPSKPTPEPVPLEVVAKLPPTKPERHLLKALLTYPECLNHSEIKDILDNVTHPEVKDIVLWLVKIYLEIDEAEYAEFVKAKVFSGNYTKEVVDVVSEALFESGSHKINEKVLDKLLKDLKIKIQLEQLTLERQKNFELQKTAKTQEEINKYLQEINRIDQTRKNLKQLS